MNAADAIFLIVALGAAISFVAALYYSTRPPRPRATFKRRRHPKPLFVSHADLRHCNAPAFRNPPKEKSY